MAGEIRFAAFVGNCPGGRDMCLVFGLSAFYTQG